MFMGPAANYGGGATNRIKAANVYPQAPGLGLGVEASAGSTGRMNRDANSLAPVGTSGPMTSGHVENAVAVGKMGSPVVWLVVLVAALVILMFGAKKLGADGDFSAIKPSFYNCLVISWAAIIGMNVWKALFTRFPVPGLSTLVLAA